MGAHPPHRHAPLLLLAGVRVGRGRGESTGRPVSWMTTCTFSLHVYRIPCLGSFFPSRFLCGCGSFRVPSESILARWSTVVHRRPDVSCRQMTLIHSITVPYCPLLPLTAPYCPLLPLSVPYWGLGDGEGLSGSRGHQASGLGSPVGQVAVACACALVDLWVLRPQCPVRCEARLSRPCPRRVGVVAR